MLILNPVIKTENFSKLIHKYYDNYGGVLSLVHKNNFLNIIEFLKYSSFVTFNQLSDLAAIDWLTFKPSFFNRFSLHYVFVSVKYSLRISFVYFFSEKEYLPSLNKLYFVSNWFEREAWDLFGAIFLNNKDLRRILNNYGFDGFPLLKSFPLTGIYEYYYSEIKKLILQKKVLVSQNFRLFYLENPWIKKISTFLKKNIFSSFFFTLFFDKQKNIFFFLFFVILLGFCIGLYDNVIFSTLTLILCFLISSLLFLYLGLELLPLIIIILYIGSLLLVFLFSILVLNLKYNIFLSNLIKLEDHLIFFILSIKLIIVWKFFFFNNNNFFLITDLKNKYFELDYITNIYINDFMIYFLLIGFLLLITSLGITSLTKFDNFLFFSKNKNLLFILNNQDTNTEYRRLHEYRDNLILNREWDSEDIDALNQSLLSLRVLSQFDKTMSFNNIASIVERNNKHIKSWHSRWAGNLERFDIKRSGTWEYLPFVDVDILEDLNRKDAKYFFDVS